MKLVIIFFVLSLVLFGCMNTGKVADDLNDVKAQNLNVTKDVVENSDLVCGNGICEINEGCNKITQETLCQEDCGLSCESKLFLLSSRCEDGCTKGLNSFEFAGAGKVKFTLKNLGEKKMDDLKANLDCKFKKGEVPYDAYFNDHKESISLEGRETGFYYIEINRPSSFELDCDVTFSSKYSVIFDKIKLIGA